MFVDNNSGIEYNRDLIHYTSTELDLEQAKELFEYLKVKLDGKV